MLKSIYDMNISDYDIKEGDIKIDSEDLRQLFFLLENYRMLLSNMDFSLTAPETEDLTEWLKTTTYLQNKYIVMADLRFQQNKWFTILKKLDDEEFTKNATAEQVDSFRREVWSYYLEAKGKRESLQNELLSYEKNS